MGGTIRKVAGFFSTAVEPLSLLAHNSSGKGVILLFHRVSNEIDSSYPPLPPDEFERHCQFYKSNFTVIPLAELIQKKETGKSLKGLLSITFDDGYRDFLTDAYPILRKHGLHSTHFLVGDCVDTGMPTWNLRLKHLVRSGNAPKDASQLLSRMPATDRNTWLLEREKSASPSSPKMLSWNDLGLFDSNLVSWGSHTVSHGMLPLLPSKEVERELVESRKVLQERTGQTVPYLSYPNGMHNPEIIQSVKQSGYSCAFAVGQKKLQQAANPYAIPRIDVGAIPRSMLAAEVTGLNSFLRGFRG